MLKVTGLHLQPGQPESQLQKKLQRELGCAVTGWRVLKKSVDARKKDRIVWVYTVACQVADEAAVLRRCKGGHVSAYAAPTYTYPASHLRFSQRPVIVGAGPAGLFCGLMLARAGARPILLERGAPVAQRTADVEQFWSTGQLNPNSNVQFGAGGAGTFSDGKLNTGTHDPRLPYILDQFVAFGAPASIRTDAAPHIGTDVLRTVVEAISQELLRLGAELRFGCQLTGIATEQNALTGVRVAGPDEETVLPCDKLVLAIGHSARDTFEMLHAARLPMAQKPFAMGVRIEHLQADITAAQYGTMREDLPVPSYKLSCHPTPERGVFSFCVCPGGVVVAAASEPGRLATNGMSYRARDGKNCNGGLLVSVLPGDFGGAHPLAGMALQRQVEEAAFRLGGGDYRAPCQTVGDFLRRVPSEHLGRVEPTYRPGVTLTDLHLCLPPLLTDTLEAAIPLLGKKLRGFDDPEAVLTAVESRSSSPVRLLRNEHYESPILGVFPCGEGAGYAGGILSAAADGIRCAEMLCQTL